MKIKNVSKESRNPWTPWIEIEAENEEEEEEIKEFTASIVKRIFTF